jgi:sugar transferase (PEP-CTERM system associated)
MIKALAHSISPRSFALIACEAVLIVAAVCGSAMIHLGAGAWEVLFVNGDIGKILLIACVCQLSLYYADLYDLRVVSDLRDLFIGLVQALSATSFALAAIYFCFPALVIGRGVFVVSSALVLVGVSGWRLIFEWVNRRVAPRERLLIVGTGPAAVSLARELFDRRQEVGIEIVGFVDVDPTRIGTLSIYPGVIGDIDDIPDIVRTRSVHRVVVSLADARGKLPMDKLLEMKLDGVSFDHLASVYEELTGKIAVENLRPSWLIFSSGFKKSHLVRAAKRVLDIVAAATGLVIAGPIMIAVAAAVRLSSPGPTIYRQQRVGGGNRLFTLYKFRSMCQDAEARTGAVWASRNDSRVTPLGRFLRRTRLDELPQLWNVLTGDMSMVGPRPERPEFVKQLTEQIPFYGQRHAIRPGLTGWAQVRYAYGASVDDSMEKLQYDLFYIKNLSIALDLFIMFSTVKTVLFRRGS